MLMTVSRERCTHTLFAVCQRILSTKPFAPAARSLTSSVFPDEEESHSQASVTYSRPHGHQQSNLSTLLKPLSGYSSSSSSDEEDSHSRIRAAKPSDCKDRYRWKSSGQTLNGKDVSSTDHIWSPLSSSSSSYVSDDEGKHTRRKGSFLRTEKTVSVFWDLDNKPPHAVPPFEAAIRLREVACSFGRLVDMVAYANRHAFSYVPSWVRDERRHRKELDRLEVSGLAGPVEPYVCGYCGRKCKTNMALKKHFKQLHERERNKRLNRLDSLKGKQKIKYKQSLIEKETRYKEASRDILAPKVGYGLMQELKRAGVWVRMVSDRPQAADEALMQHISDSIDTGIGCICLVSDDSDFLPILHEAKAQHLHTVVVGDKKRLRACADVQFSWSDLASGRAFDQATELASMWYGQHRWGASKSHVRCSPMDVARFPARVGDFQDWDVSDSSDVESEEACDAESKDESSSGLLLSEDGADGYVDADYIDDDDDDDDEDDDH